MTRSEKAKEIIEEILDDITFSKLPLSSILRKYIRVTQLLDMPDDRVVVEKELKGYENGDMLPAYRILNCSKRYSWEGTLPAVIIRASGLKDEFYKPKFQAYYLNDSVSRLEIYLGKGITYNMGEHVLYGVNVSDLITITPEQLLEVLQTITNNLFEDCSLLSINLEFGNQSATIFQEKEDMVRTFLQKVSPKTLDKLNVATDTLKDGDKGIHWSQVSLACIESLINFSNDIYHEEYLPAGEKKLGHQDYKRKIAFTLHREFLNKGKYKYIEKMVEFIESLNDYLQANKHAPDVSGRYDARRCLIYTYLLMSDLIELLSEKKGGVS